jgi:hypothetical protein
MSHIDPALAKAFTNLSLPLISFDNVASGGRLVITKCTGLEASEWRPEKIQWRELVFYGKSDPGVSSMGALRYSGVAEAGRINSSESFLTLPTASSTFRDHLVCVVWPQ